MGLVWWKGGEKNQWPPGPSQLQLGGAVSARTASGPAYSTGRFAPSADSVLGKTEAPIIESRSIGIIFI